MAFTTQSLAPTLAALLCAAACGRNPRYCDEQTACGYEGWVCDLQGTCPASDNLTNSCIRPDQVCWDAGTNDAGTSCSPSFAGCVATGTMPEWVACDAEGNETSRRPCPLGCDDFDGCSDIDPSNGLAIYLDETQAENGVVLSGAATIDTNTGTVTDSNGTVIVETFLTNGIRVLIARSLSTGDVTVSGSYPLAVVAHGEILIAGNFSVSADGPTPGPGARSGVANPCVGVDGVGDLGLGQWSGGGGGSFGSSGGRGGNHPNMDGGAPGVPASGEDLEPLVGGCAGGNYDIGADQILDSGGAGGGALQLVSRTGIRFAGGTISASGGGAGPTGMDFLAGGGGGSGGGLLLETPAVSASGTSGIFANGGGGSCKNLGDGLSVAGSNGLLSTSPAAGGACPLASDAGAGGSLQSPEGATGEDTADGSLTTTGGGGGGTGVIRVNVPGAVFTPPAALGLSPAASVGVLRARTTAP